MSDKPDAVALTGATGFVGRHVLSRLLEGENRVRALCRSRKKTQVNHPKLEWIEGDLFDPASLDRLTQGVEAVIHIVGIIMEKPSKGQTFQRVHVEGTRNLLDAGTRAGDITRWVHMSALGARRQAEANYHRTKWQAEQLVRESGLDWTIFRPSIIHGPDGEFMEMVRDLWAGFFPPFVPYFGAGLTGRGGAGKLQPVWVDDVAECFVRALELPGTIGETYPLGGPRAFTWPQMYETVRKHLPAARAKAIMPIPVWYAKAIAGLPGVPFNRDQVIMSQEDSTCQTTKVQRDFDLNLADFEDKLAQYAARIGD